VSNNNKQLQGCSGVDGGSQKATSQPKLGVGSHLALSLHSSHEPSELLE